MSGSRSEAMSTPSLLQRRRNSLFLDRSLVRQGFEGRVASGSSAQFRNGSKTDARVSHSRFAGCGTTKVAVHGLSAVFARFSLRQLSNS